MNLRSHVLALAGLTLLLAGPSRADEQPSLILNGSAAVPGGNYFVYEVKSPGANAITGHVVAVGGSGNDIEVYVLSESDYLNWKNGHDTKPLYNSGRVTAADVRADLPGPGTYYVVLSNTFSKNPKTVTGNLALAPAAEETESETMLGVGTLIGFVVGVVMGGLVAAFVMSRRKKRAVSGGQV